MAKGVRRVDLTICVFWRVVTSDERLGQSMRVLDVVKTETAFHTQTLLVGGAVSALHRHNLFVSQLIGNLTTHPAVGTNTRHLLETVGVTHASFVY